MPLNGIGSYLTTMDEVSAHWDDVNIILGGTPATELKLQGGFTRTMFITVRTDLSGAITALEDLENARETAVVNRDQKKTGLTTRLIQFRGMLRGLLPTSVYAGAAPLVPTFGLSETRFLAPFDDMASLWARIDADATIAGFTPPLVMAGYTRAMFVAELAALRTAYAAVTVAENDLDIGRKQRDVFLPIARERMIQYRELVVATLGPTHPLSLSLPALSSAPGSTPEPVTLSGGWNGALALADLSWTGSTNPALQEYEVRGSDGDTYDEATSVLVANLPPGTLSLQTANGLTASGKKVTFKVIVKLTTGNQAASNPITITRP